MSTTSPNNNKKGKKITAEQTIILIRLIKKYDSLWNPDNPDFRDRDLRKHLFEKIGNYFRLPGEDVRRKFRRLRNSYRQRLKHIRDGQELHRTTFYFEEMEFLRGQIEQSLAQRRLSPNSETSITKEDDVVQGAPTESFEEMFTFECAEFDIESEPTESNTIEDLDINELPNGDEEEHHKQHKRSSTSGVNADEFDIFARYLASQLREMDKLSGLETMEELQQIVLQRRIGALKRDMSNKADSVAQYRYSLKRSKEDNG